MKSSSGGKAPYFVGDAVFPSREVIQKMRELYEMDGSRFNAYIYNLLNFRKENDFQLLEKGRQEYAANKLDKTHFFTIGPTVITVDTIADHLWFPWAGEHLLQGLLASLRYAGIPAAALRITVLIQNRSVKQIHSYLCDILESFPTLDNLVRSANISSSGKFDWCLSPSFWRKEKIKWLSNSEEIISCLEQLRSVLSAMYPDLLK